MLIDVLRNGKSLVSTDSRTFKRNVVRVLGEMHEPAARQALRSIPLKSETDSEIRFYVERELITPIADQSDGTSVRRHSSR